MAVLVVVVGKQRPEAPEAGMVLGVLAKMEETAVEVQVIVPL
jgi:hypothetical protein